MYGHSQVVMVANLEPLVFHSFSLIILSRIKNYTVNHHLVLDLMWNWYDGVAGLPRSTIENISLDVTVAPGWTREDASERTRNEAPDGMLKDSKWYFERLLRDSRIGRIFSNDRLVDIPRLARLIFNHFERNVTIKLTGTLGSGNWWSETDMMRRFIAGE
jgi:hypothetical protein